MVEQNGAAPDFKAEFDPAKPIVSYVRVVSLVVSKTRPFFEAMPPKAGYLAPVLFALISFLVPGLILALTTHTPSATFFYLLVMVGWILFVGLLHLAATKLVPGRGGFEATLRVAAYTTFTNLVGFIPVPLFGLAFHIYGLYLICHGLSVVHGLRLGQALKALVVVVIGLVTVNLILLNLLFRAQ